MKLVALIGLECQICQIRFLLVRKIRWNTDGSKKLVEKAHLIQSEVSIFHFVRKNIEIRTITIFFLKIFISNFHSNSRFKVNEITTLLIRWICFFNGNNTMHTKKSYSVIETFKIIWIFKKKYEVCICNFIINNFRRNQ